MSTHTNTPHERRLERLEAGSGRRPAPEDAAAQAATERRLAELAAVAGFPTPDAFRAHLWATRQAPTDSLDTALRDWLMRYLTGCYPPRGPDPI